MANKLAWNLQNGYALNENGSIKISVTVHNYFGNFMANSVTNVAKSDFNSI